MGALKNDFKDDKKKKINLNYPQPGFFVGFGTKNVSYNYIYNSLLKMCTQP